jgi:hypothetical protein
MCTLIAQLSPEAVAVGMGLGFFALVGLLILLSLASLAFWIWMLVDCAQTPEKPGGNEKLVWILILIFTSWLGALLYFFIVRQQRRASLRAAGFTSPPLPGR